MTLEALEKEPVCNRCGRCCYYQKNGRWTKCKNLAQFGKLSSCRIWNNPERLTVPIDDGIYCAVMSEHGFTYRGCPYNKEKPLLLVPIKPFYD